MKHGEQVKINILETGMSVWLEDYAKVSASEIARRMGIRHSNVFYHFPKGTLKQAIAEYAVRVRNPAMIRFLIATGNDAVSILTPEERMAFLQVEPI